MFLRAFEAIRLSTLTLVTVVVLLGCDSGTTNSSGIGSLSPDNEWSVVRQGLFCNDIWCAADGELFSVGSHGSVYHYDGSDWHFSKLGADARFLAVWGSSARDVYAAGERGVCFHFDGSEWSELDMGNTTYFNIQDIWGSSADNVYLVGTDGTVKRYDGQLWEQLDPFTDIHWNGTYYAVWGSGPDDVYVGGCAMLRHFDGESWTRIEDPLLAGCCIHKIDGTQSDKVYALTSQGAVEKRQDAWVSLSDSNDNIRDIWVAPNGGLHGLTVVGNTLWSCEYVRNEWQSVEEVSASYDGRANLCGDNHGNLYTGLQEIFQKHSRDRSELMLYRPTDVFSSVAVTSRGQVFVVGLGLTMQSDGDPDEWVSAGGPTMASKISILPDRSIVATGSSSDVWIYDGGSWLSLNLNQDHSVGLRGLWGVSVNDFFVSGSNGGIFHYDGDEFALQETPTTEFIYSLWGSSNRDIHAVAAHGVILHYDGAAWSSMDCPTDVYLFDVYGFAPDNIYAVGQYGVMLHYDGAAWSLIDSGTDEFLSNIWATDPNNIFVSGYGVILHYDGTGWEEMNCPTELNLYGIGGSGSNDVYAVGSYGTIVHYGPKLH